MAMYKHGCCIGWKELGGQCLMMRSAECKPYNPMNSLRLSQQCLASQIAFADAGFSLSAITEPL